MSFEHGGNVHEFLRNQKDAKVIDFSANINPMGMSPLGQAQMQMAHQWLMHYPDPDYVALRQALAAYYQIDMSWLSVYNGAAEAMHAVFKWLKPKTALLHGPSFVEYEKILTGLSTHCEWVILEPERQFAFDLEAYCRQLTTQKPDIAIICTPNNPTGQLVSHQALETVATTLKAWQGVLIIDEAFIDFLGESHSFSQSLAVNDNVFIFRSFTKFFGVPGLRLGALITSNQAVHAHERQYGVPWRINSFAEHYAIGAVQDDAYIQASRAYVRTERVKQLARFKHINGLETMPSEADYLLIKVSPIIAEQLVSELASKGMLIRDCSQYKGLGKGYFRVAIKGAAENEALAVAIEEVLGNESHG